MKKKCISLHIYTHTGTHSEPILYKPVCECVCAKHIIYVSIYFKTFCFIQIIIVYLYDIWLFRLAIIPYVFLCLPQWSQSDHTISS